MPARSSSLWSRLLRRVERAVGAAAGDFVGDKLRRRADTAPGYPGDFTGVPELAYAPRPDGHPDPGEIVWAWIPFEENPTAGKDRPALILGHDGPWLLVAPLTSKDHDLDAAQEHAAGRDWIDIGVGAWDRQGRRSEVRVNRIVRIDPGTVRREGAVLPRDRFEEVAAAIRARSGGAR